MSVLVVAAHPDDEVLGCGGTIARWSDEGVPVSLLILGEGETSRYNDPTAAPQGNVQALAAQSREAAAILGVGDVTLLGLPDNRFDTVALLDVVKLIETALERVQPTVVLTQHGGDLNVDHQVTYRATLAATRPLPGQSVREVLSFEVGSSTEWAFHKLTPAFHPTVFVDVSSTIERKVEALLAYVDEVRPFPHPRSPEAVRAKAQSSGSVVGVPAAEPFELVRSLR